MIKRTLWQQICPPVQQVPTSFLDDAPKLDAEPGEGEARQKYEIFTNRFQKRIGLPKTTASERIAFGCKE